MITAYPPAVAAAAFDAGEGNRAGVFGGMKRSTVRLRDRDDAERLRHRSGFEE